MSSNSMHFLKNSWQFSFKITEKTTRISFEKPPFTCETHYVCQGCVLNKWVKKGGGAGHVCLAVCLNLAEKKRQMAKKLKKRDVPGTLFLAGKLLL